jgi:hypothetical protein
MLSPRQFSQPEFPGMPGRLTPDDVKSRANKKVGQTLATFGNMAISTVPEKAFGIARTGDIRTQHETGTSGGIVNPSFRAELEADMGFERYPVYGYLRRGDENPPYGNVDFQLKPSVKKRSTMVVGDSMNEMLEDWGTSGEVHLDPKPVSEVASGLSEAPLTSFYDSYDDAHYVETQILSDDRPETLGSQKSTRVPMADVHRVDIYEDDRAYSRGANRRENFRVGREFHSLGVPVDHVLTDITEQPVLPMDYQVYNDDWGAFLNDPPSPVFGTRKRRVRHEDLSGIDRGE